MLILIDYNGLLSELIAKTLTNAVGMAIDRVIALLSESNLNEEDLNIETEHSSNGQYIYDKIYVQITSGREG